jgi:hypothetical protein
MPRERRIALNPRTAVPVRRPMRVLLRLEGLSALMLALLVYRQQHASGNASWLLFAVFFLAPNLSMLGYLARPRAGAIVYSIVHSYQIPAYSTVHSTA